jgi:charged multivesicular body protein 2A
MRSTASMAKAMKGVSKAMATMNKKMNLPEIQRIMMEFEKQSEIMDMKDEMMSDAVDDVIGEEDDEEEGYANGCL